VAVRESSRANQVAGASSRAPVGIGSPGRSVETASFEGAEHGFVRYESRDQLIADTVDGTHIAINPGKRYDERAARTMIDWLNRVSP